MAGNAFKPPEEPASKNCNDPITWSPYPGFDYIVRTTTGDNNYPVDACIPELQTKAFFDELIITKSVVVAESVTSPKFNGNLTGNVTGTATGNKTLAAFDIPHVTQKGKRIRHIIAEGPEPGIYIRGKLTDSNVIELPEYWDGLVDPETITVTLTQIGYSQDLIVEGIEWGKRIKIKSGTGSNINCFYEVWAARWLNPMNHNDKLHIVYDGETPDDYPGDNSQFLVGGWDYDRRNPQWEPLDKEQ